VRKPLYQQLARLGKAVSNPNRLELLDLLTQGPCSVETLARKAGLTVGNASQHLGVLRNARLVEADKEGLFVTYRLAGPEVAGLFLGIRSVGEQRLAEIDQIIRQFRSSPEPLEAVNRDALLERVRTGKSTVLDVRPEDEYRAGHIPGALSVPLERLEACLEKLPRGREIVAYCRGPYCVLAVEAVEILRSHGFQATRLDDGVLEWGARGYDIATAGTPSQRAAGPSRG
jgi:rhodanese-related sulfurtransferase